MKIVPLVSYVNGNREIVGEARIDTDGNITGIIKRGHPILKKLIDSNFSYSLVTEEANKTKENTNGIH